MSNKYDNIFVIKKKQNVGSWNLILNNE